MGNVYKKECITVGNAHYFRDDGYVPPEGGRQDRNPHVAAMTEAAAAKAMEEKAQILEMARRQGEIQGCEDARNQALREWTENTQNALSRISDEFDTASAAMRRENEHRIRQINDEALGLAFTLAKDILRTETKKNEEAFISLYRNAAGRITDAERMILLAGPVGCRIAARRKKELEGLIHGLRELEIRQAETGDGTCILKTLTGSIDVSIETQLKKAAQTAGYEME